MAGKTVFSGSFTTVAVTGTTVPTPAGLVSLNVNTPIGTDGSVTGPPSVSMSITDGTNKVAISGQLDANGNIVNGTGAVGEVVGPAEGRISISTDGTVSVQVNLDSTPDTLGNKIQQTVKFSVNIPAAAEAFNQSVESYKNYIKAIDSNIIQQTLEKQDLIDNGIPQCFLAGTPILMSDGTEKPIEDIKPGDEVMAFDGGDSQGRGPLAPKKVTRLFRNVTKSIIDLRGLKMTPGHMVLSDNGDWLTIADVLRNDRSIVEERKTGAVLVRARTGAVIGSLDDTPIPVLFVDQKTGRQHQAYVRAGIPALGKYLTPNKAELWTLARILTDEGYTVSPDGWMTLPNGQRFNATPWPASSPFETEMMLSWIISVDGVPYTPPWIADIREDEEREAVNAGFSQPHSAISFRPANPASARPLNRAERRRQATLRVVK